MSVKNNMDLEEEIAMLKKENKKLNSDNRMFKKANKNCGEIIKKLEGEKSMLLDALECWKADNKKLKKENEDLNKKKSIKWSREYATPRIKELENEKDCAHEELKTLEVLLRLFAEDNKLPEEGLDCHGCRIRQIGTFIAFMIDGMRKESETVVQATPI